MSKNYSNTYEQTPANATSAAIFDELNAISEEIERCRSIALS